MMLELLRVMWLIFVHMYIIIILWP